MVEVIGRIVGAGIVAYPDFSLVDMRGIGVTGLITVVALRRGRCRGFMGRRRRRYMGWRAIEGRRTVFRNGRMTTL
jgi:hypothetical protein